MLKSNLLKKVLTFSMVTVLSITMAVPQLTNADQKSDAESKKESLQNEKDNQEQLLRELDSLKNDAEAYIEKIDGQLTDVATKIQNLKKQSKQKNKEIKETEVELEDAKESVKDQYSDMKLRIQFMYENGNTEYVQLLLSATSVADFLNKAEYVSNITEYDQKMLDKLKNTEDTIANSKKKLEADYANLKEMTTEQQTKEKDLQVLYEKKNSDLTDIKNKTAEGNKKVSGYELEIDNQNNLLAEIEAAEKAQAEEASKRALEEASRLKASREQASIEQASREQEKQTTQKQTTPSYNGGSSNGNESNGGDGSFDDNPSVSKPSSSGYVWPLPSGYHRVSTEFGENDAFGRAGHCGVDYPAPSGTPIYAVASGTVTLSTYTSGTGNCVKINHGNGLESVYMHLSAFNCSAGQTVAQGQVIGYVGTTGPSTGNHLHISFKLNGAWVNPHNYIGY